MANTFIKKVKKNEFDLIETETNQILHKTDSYETARKFARFYNNGGGFAGNTPPFMLRKVA